MNSKVTYHQQVSYCGKPRCRRCREGIGHGPYWYAYQAKDGRTTRTYVGKQLPPEIQASMEGVYGQTVMHAPDSTQHSEREQATMRVYALGQFRLERRSGSEWQIVTESAWQHQRVRGLLSCLVSVPTRKLGREQLMDALWPDLDMETAGNRLDRAVYSLRQVFEPSRSKLATSPFLLTEREMLVLADAKHIWLDADAFEQLISQAHRKSDPAETERLLEEAMRLYGGEFLPEERSLQWVHSRRETLRRSWISLLLEIADLRVKREDLVGAIDPLDRLLAVDPANEAAVQSLMRLLAQLGRRGEALRAYRDLATVLQEEYRIQPLPETRSLFEALRSSGSLPAKRPTPPTNPNSLGPQFPTKSVGARFIAPSVGGGGTSTPTDAPITAKTSGPVRAQSIVPPANAATASSPYLQIGRTHQSKLVGRADELKLLYGMLSETERSAKFKLPGQKRLAAQPFDVQRRPQALLLMGDVGVGKTRLAEEMGREAKRRGWVVAWSRVYAQEGSIPYRLWVEVLRKTMSQGRGVGAATYPPGMPMYVPPQIVQRPLIFQPLAALLPELQSILPEVSFQNAQPPEHEQLRLWEAARELLTTISESTPLLIVLDDLQWSDSSSCELLAYLARRTQGYPILIVGTCRDRELPSDHPLRPLLTDLQREHAMTTMQVELLSDEHIAALIAAMPHLPAPLVPHIRTRAAGNPFFAEELARVIDPVRAQTDLDSVRAQFIVPPSTPTNAPDNANTFDHIIPHLPETINAVLDLRLARLSPACHRLLSKAAVLGGSFAFPIIYAMERSTLSTDAQNIDEDTVLDLLEEALQSGMLTEEGTGTHITYHFWHPLLVSHLYEGLSAARRASLHRRAADVLRHAHAKREGEVAATITHHLLLGGANDQLIAHYAEMAGDRAYKLSDYPHAEKYYKITVEHIGTVKERDELLHLSYVLERLAESVTIQGKNEEARRFYEQILEVRSQLPPPASNDEHLQEAQINALLWGEIGKTWYDIGNTVKAREYYQRSEQVLQEAGVVSGFVWARLHLLESYSYWREGSYEEACRKAQEARELFEQAFEQQDQGPKLLSLSTPVRRILTGDPIDLGRAYALLGLIADEAGRCTEALTHLNAALTSYEQHDRQREIAIVCCNLGDVYLRRAEHILAQSALRRSLSLAEKIGEIPLISVIFGNLGVLSMRNGNLIEAEDWFRQSLVLAERMNNPVYMSLWNAALATVLQDRSKFSEAAKHLAQGLSLGRSTRISPRIGFALVSLGDMRIAEALAISDKQDKTRTHLLMRARSTLQRALGLQELEAETRTKGQLLLAQVEQLMDNVELAQQQAMHTLQEAQRFELAALAARAQRLLGIIYAVHGNQEEAKQQFEQALQMFRKSGMRLDHARTLQQYGMFLIRQDGVQGKEYQRGLGYLQEARQMFKECNASLDLQLVERELS